MICLDQKARIISVEWCMEGEHNMLYRIEADTTNHLTLRVAIPFSTSTAPLHNNKIREMHLKSLSRTVGRISRLSSINSNLQNNIITSTVLQERPSHLSQRISARIRVLRIVENVNPHLRARSFDDKSRSGGILRLDGTQTPIRECIGTDGAVLRCSVFDFDAGFYPFERLGAGKDDCNTSLIVSGLPVGIDGYSNAGEFVCLDFAVDIRNGEVVGFRFSVRSPKIGGWRGRDGKRLVVLDVDLRMVECFPSRAGSVAADGGRQGNMFRV